MPKGKQKPTNKVRSQTIKHHSPTVNFLLQLTFIANKIHISPSLLTWNTPTFYQQ